MHYEVSINHPEGHYVSVTIKVKHDFLHGDLRFFLPVWSPGSYMVREYSRHVKSVRASDEIGHLLLVEQVQKNIWSVLLPPEVKNFSNHEVTFSYEVYAHEVSVRTSFIDATHAFLHGPSYLMGVDQEMSKPHKLELKFPAIWSKVNTGLKDVSPTRERFVYEAPCYDDLLDCPIEIGCHETDGFMLKGVPHELAFYGNTWPHKNNVKKDIQKIVECVSDHFGKKLPYERYVFITHFLPGFYGGLEHQNSTALHYDGTTLSDRKSYLNWLALVAHEYFHTWNIKRIRPVELGPFNYQREAMTQLLWLAEGLTSFVDDLFVYRAGLMTIGEYAEVIKGNLEKYYNTPGKNYHSVEQSSFNAWIKLYRPDENSANSSISYYLKGGLIFMMLHLELKTQNKSINDFLTMLWERYLQNPKSGMTRQEVLDLVQKLGGEKICQKFDTMISTSEAIDFETALKHCGMEFVWEDSPMAYIGMSPRMQEGRVYVDSVVLDGPANRQGLNAGDEILALDGVRVLREQYEKFEKNLIPNQSYRLLVSRLGHIREIILVTDKKPRLLKEIKVVNQSLAEVAFK